MGDSRRAEDIIGTAARKRRPAPRDRSRPLAQLDQPAISPQGLSNVSVPQLFVAACIFLSPAWLSPWSVLLGQQPAASENGDAATVPPLSVETIYHPDKRFSYAEPSAPTTRWTSSEGGTTRLLIKRSDQWMQIDPPSLAGDDPPAESPWAGAAQLVAQLRSLGDVDQKQAESLVDRWIGDASRSLGASLVRIEHGIALAGLEVTPRWVTRQASAWQDPQLSPDASRVAYVQDNDLYVWQLSSGETRRITDDGSPTRLNGRLDWVYQEELYGRGTYRAFWWSHDSRSLAFLRLDNSEVAEFTITTSRGPRGGTSVQRYPKAGDASTHAELWMASLDRSSARGFSLIPVFTPRPSEQLLIVRVGWQSETGDLIFQHTDRVQSELTLWRFRPRGDRSQPVAILRERAQQWIEIIGLPHWLPGGDFLWLSDLPSGRRRLWRISGDGSQRIPLTPDGFDCRELVAVDPDRGVALLSGDDQRGVSGQQLYGVPLQPRRGDDGDPPKLSLKRVTDDQWPWHQVEASDDSRWIVDSASSLEQPPTLMLCQVGSHWTAGGEDSSGQAVGHCHVLHEPQLRLPAAPIPARWVEVETPDGLRLPAYYYRPRSDDDDQRRFPVLVETYGGPLAPTTRDSWNSARYLYHQLLASRGVAVMVVDNRSSGGRGLADAWAIHRQVGQLEAADVETAARWLADQSWVDADRLALRGWSFGGFLTLRAMTSSDRFVAGVAGGSVTDWRNYDSIYTERYMGLPQDNPQGYDQTSPLKAAGDLSGRVLLIHGEVDDNVHLLNTLQMAAALQRAGKPLEMMIYPGSAHGVQHGMPTYHLMVTINEFLFRQLDAGPAPIGSR